MLYVICSTVQLEFVIDPLVFLVISIICNDLVYK